MRRLPERYTSTDEPLALPLKVISSLPNNPVGNKSVGNALFIP